jgi:hypothetical protein
LTTVLLRVDDRVELHRLDDGTLEVVAHLPAGDVRRGPTLPAAVDLSDALSFLARRWAELEPDPALARRARAMVSEMAYGPINDGDWDAVTARHDPDVVCVDHRPASLGVVEGRDRWIAMLRTAIEQAPDSNYRTGDLLALAPGFGTLTELHVSGTTTDGFEFERFVLVLYLYGPTGRIVRLEMFPAEDRAAAAARFDELVGAARSELG